MPNPTSSTPPRSRAVCYVATCATLHAVAEQVTTAELSRIKLYWLDISACDPVEKSLSHLNVAGHPDLRIALQRLTKQRSRFFAIAYGGAIHQHHRVKAPNLRLFEEIGIRLSLLHRDLKVLYRSFPMMRRCRRDARNRLCQAENRPKHCRSSVD